MTVILVAKFYMVTVQWLLNPIHPPLIEGVLGLHSDWIRLSPHTWLVYSEQAAKSIGDRIQATLAGDNYMMVRMDPYDMYGQEPAWVWSWVAMRLNGAKPGTLPAPIAPSPPYSLPRSQ